MAQFRFSRLYVARESWPRTPSQDKKGIVCRQRTCGRARTAPVESLERLLNLPAIKNDCSGGGEHRSQSRELKQFVGHISRSTLLYGGGNKKGAASKDRAIVAESGEAFICEIHRRRDEMRRHGIRHRLPSAEPLRSARGLRTAIPRHRPAAPESPSDPFAFQGQHARRCKIW